VKIIIKRNDKKSIDVHCNAYNPIFST